MSKNDDYKLVGKLCEKFGVTVDSARIQISDGRKIGFIVDYGQFPNSINCFAMESPTPSTALERQRPRQGLCLIPQGFKILGVVDGCIYMGEVVYSESWKRGYRFHLYEGEKIVASSSICANPTSAFKEIEQAIRKCDIGKKRKQGKTVARSNGKLYMAVMYTSTQKILRNVFRNQLDKLDGDVKATFMEWLNSDQSLHRSTNNNRSFYGDYRERTSSSEEEPSKDDENDSIEYQDEPESYVNVFNQPTRGERSSSLKRPSSESDLSGSIISRKRTSIDTASCDISCELPIESEQEQDKALTDLELNMLLQCFEISSDTQNPSITLEPHEEELSIVDLYEMNPQQLFEALKGNDSNLSFDRLHSALSSVFQIPRENLTTSFVQDIFRALGEENGKVTYENFIRTITARENEISMLFRNLDKDNDGVITLDELRAAQEHFLIDSSLDDDILYEFIVRMDELSLRCRVEYAWDRKIQYCEFRTMLILLPSSQCLSMVFDHFRRNLAERQSELLS